MGIEYANWYSNLFLTCNYLLSSAYKGKITLKIFVRIFLIVKASITQRWIKHGKQWVYYYCYCCCCFWGKVPLYCSDCSGTQYVNEAGRDLPASASGVLGLRLWATTTRSESQQSWHSHKCNDGYWTLSTRAHHPKRNYFEPTEINSWYLGVKMTNSNQSIFPRKTVSIWILILPFGPFSNVLFQICRYLEGKT